MWFAGNWFTAIVNLDSEMSHPENIRKWFNDQPKEALLVGRKLHKSNQAFGQWCKEMGFDDMHRNYRSAAMWLAQNWTAVTASTTCTSDPIQLQKDFNDQPKEALPATFDSTPRQSVVKPTTHTPHRRTNEYHRVPNAVLRVSPRVSPRAAPRVSRV